MKESLFPINPQYTREYIGIVFTDLDGTLLDNKRRLKDKDFRTLVHLKKEGFLRVLATGRNLHSLFKVIDHSFPIDYVIFSSGAGIFNLQTKDYVRIVTMDSREVQKAACFFIHNSLDFAVHRPIPDNHYFSYYMKNGNNCNFDQRILMYKKYAYEWKSLPGRYPRASQLLSIITWQSQGLHSDFKELYEKASEELPGFTVIRATSPLDHQSLWIEVFPLSVSKGKTASWLTSLCQVDHEKTLAIGNDYNDLDLLSWAHEGYVVSNGPKDIKESFPTVASHNHCGFSEAVRKWLG